MSRGTIPEDNPIHTVDEKSDCFIIWISKKIGIRPGKVSTVQSYGDSNPRKSKKIISLIQACRVLEGGIKTCILRHNAPLTLLPIEQHAGNRRELGNLKLPECHLNVVERIALSIYLNLNRSSTLGAGAVCLFIGDLKESSIRQFDLR
ncbi:hypothetical protein HHI36_020990 [Cryptolaemus montrouzieri]|uniref:Uncharacterized protein n=1 Tax=Cryptolaemus montrouzieri TaxID=559131 RepID=A0ABD2MVD6_9CUCU